MWSRRHFLAGAAGLAVAPSAWGQTALRGADLAGDIAILREAYETLHAGLYRYATPAQITARFDALAEAWRRDQTRAEAYLTLSRFLASVRCGHTYANFYNQARAVQEELFAGPTRLPFHFVWLDGRMIVTANHSGEPLLGRGAEIVAVDGRRASRLLDALVPYARADGGNDDKRRSLLQVRGYNRFEYFDIFQGLLFPPRDGAFRLRVRAPGENRARAVEVAPIDLAARRTAMRAAADRNAPAWTLSYPDERTALLTMPTWALYNSTWDWRAFLDGAFAEFATRGVTKLIVDLRGNEGGLDCGHDIIARLIDRDLPLESYERRVRFQRTPDHLNPYLDTWDNSFRTLGESAEAIGDGWFRLPEAAHVTTIAPRGPRFAGNLVVLIDGDNSSATFQFANTIRTNRLGRLIGAPTGGNQRGINGGSFFFLRLPASGIEADLPLVGAFPRTPRPDAGLQPDTRIVPTREDVAAERDPVLAAALGT